MGIFLVVGAAAGAALMYINDPEMGNQRRAAVRDQVNKLIHPNAETSTELSDEEKYRAEKSARESRKRIVIEDIPDGTLVERVRAAMGDKISHPGAIEVTANNGVVTLKGDILASELQPFMAATKRIAGVQRIENELRVHDEDSNAPELRNPGYSF